MNGHSTSAAANAADSEIYIKKSFLIILLVYLGANISNFPSDIIVNNQITWDLEIVEKFRNLWTADLPNGVGRRTAEYMECRAPEIRVSSLQTLSLMSPRRRLIRD